MAATFKQRMAPRCRLLLVSVLAVFLLGGITSAETPRPGYLGFEPAYPLEPPSSFRHDFEYGFATDSIRLMTLSVSANGRYVSVQLPRDRDTADLPLVQSLVSWLGPVDFEPARLHGEPVASLVPVWIRFRPDGVVPEMHFVVDHNREVRDYDLYRLMLIVNEVEPPSLVTFPPYHAIVELEDSLDIYPYMLLRLELDTSGRAISIEPVRNTLPGFTDQIVHACNWAEFEPARVNGEVVAAPVYVMLSFFRAVSYPTQPWQHPPDDSLLLQRRMAVSVRADTLGLLAKPIPRNVYTGRFTLTELPGASFSSATIWTEVDTLGMARGLRVSSPYDQTVRRFRTMVDQLRFYPALDQSGEPVRFVGPMSARFAGSADVRIRFLWLLWDNPVLFFYCDNYQ
ncbi:hypothetical protein GF420_01110 [candidate division GN15 bacterium]|nr:hypothetical protein [candidate division GN15 bacterium]